MTAAFTVFLTTLVVALGLTGAAGWYARRRGLLAIPDERSSHATAVPSGAGAGIVLSWMLVSVFMLQGVAPQIWLVGILPGCLVLAVVGWIDDQHPVRASLRFAVQLGVSFCLLVLAAVSGALADSFMMILAGLWLMWLANLYNFMDGSHGMAGTQGVFSGLVLAWLLFQADATGLALVCVMIAASCLGFLPWNLAPRRVFMGDVGSVPLGFAFAGICVLAVGQGNISIAQAVLVMAVFLVDATLTLLGRMIRGERWYTAHRQHLYQRLIVSGRSHESVLALYTLINIMLVLPVVVVTVRNPELEWFMAVGLIATMVAGWTLAIRRLGVTA